MAVKQEKVNNDQAVFCYLNHDQLLQVSELPDTWDQYLKNYLHLSRQFTPFADLFIPQKAPKMFSIECKMDCAQLFHFIKLTPVFDFINMFDIAQNYFTLLAEFLRCF